MTVFKMRRYKKQEEVTTPPTAKTDESTSVIPFGTFGSEGPSVSPEKTAHPDRLPSGHLNAAVLQLQQGRCASCARWEGPDEYGLGLCPVGRAAHGWLDGNPKGPVTTTPLHECAAHAGRGWKSRN